MEWNVYYYNINRKVIETYNIFNHSAFKTGVLSLCDNKKTHNMPKFNFEESLHSLLRYYFWAKSEWEILLTPWIGENLTKKIDVYNQVRLNWNTFVDYCWNERWNENK